MSSWCLHMVPLWGSDFTMSNDAAACFWKSLPTCKQKGNRVTGRCPGFEIHTGFDRVCGYRCVSYSPMYLSHHLCANWLIVSFIITVWRSSAGLWVNAKLHPIPSGPGIYLSGSFKKYIYICIYLCFCISKACRGMQLNMQIDCTVSWKSASICDNTQ